MFHTREEAETFDRQALVPKGNTIIARRNRERIDRRLTNDSTQEYDFYIVNDGIDKRSSMLRSRGHRRRSSAAAHAAQIEQRTRRRNSTARDDGGQDHHVPRQDESAPHKLESEAVPVTGSTDDGLPRASGSATNVDEDMGDLTSSMAALRFVPPSVRFGRGGRAGLSSR